MIKKPDKKSILYLGIVLMVAVLVCIGLVYYFSLELTEQEPAFTERSLEEVLKDLTAPDGEIESVSQKVIESLTAPE